jgi:hypothetical protein
MRISCRNRPWLVSVGVKLLVAVTAGCSCKGVGEDGEMEFALENELKDAVTEAVVFDAMVVGAERGILVRWERREGIAAVTWGAVAALVDIRVAQW